MDDQEVLVEVLRRRGAVPGRGNGADAMESGISDEGPYGIGGKRGAYTCFMAGGAGKAFVHTSGGRTVCLDAATGELLWDSPLGNGELRTVVKHILVTSHDGAAIGLDVKTGAKLWETAGAGNRAGSPLVWVHGGRNYVIMGARGGIVCLDAATGTIVWREEDVGAGNAMILAGDYLVCGVAAGRRAPHKPAAFRLSLDGMEQVWKLDEHRVPHAICDGARRHGLPGGFA